MVYKNLDYFFCKNIFFFNKKTNLLCNNKFDFFLKKNNKTIIDCFFSEKKFFVQIENCLNSYVFKTNLILKYFSIQKYFTSQEWYEREINEMSKKKVKNVYDSRTLLLMYSFFLNKNERYYKEDKG